MASKDKQDLDHNLCLNISFTEDRVKGCKQGHNLCLNISSTVDGV